MTSSKETNGCIHLYEDQNGQFLCAAAIFVEELGGNFFNLPMQLAVMGTFGNPTDPLRCQVARQSPEKAENNCKPGYKKPIEEIIVNQSRLGELRFDKYTAPGTSASV